MCRANIGPKTGPKTDRRAGAATGPKRENPHQNWVLRVELAGLEPATSCVRSRRSLPLSLVFCRVFAAVEARPETPVSASFWPFRLGSGQRNAVLARSRRRRGARRGTTFTRELSDDVSRL